MKAKYFTQEDNKQVRCWLCPHNCLINPGKRGICRVRKNVDGELISDNYGLVSSIAVDPIEKKPLYHFYPGSKILSVGSIGCNLYCKFCQNYEISQSSVDDFPNLREYTPKEIVALAIKEMDNLGIAYTYNEPAIWYEFMLDTARIANRENLKNVIVSNGYISPDPLQELLPFIDAFNIDLKAFTNTFYKHQTSASLPPVLETLKIISKAGKHLEITNLVIPDVNDDEKIFEQMIKWIASELGENTVLHLSRYFPTYRMVNNSTPPILLETLKDIAGNYLKYVYLGNLRSNSGHNTFCPECGAMAIKRAGYLVSYHSLGRDGRCTECGYRFDGMVL